MYMPRNICALTDQSIQVPIRSPHTFSNPTNEEAKFFNTFTPAFYVNYFKLIASYMDEDNTKVLTPEINMKAMASYATIPLPR